MFKILGLKKEKGIPNFDGHKDFIHPASWDKFEQVVQECIKGMPFKIVLKVLFPDQSVHYMLTQGFPRRNPEGEIYELYGTSQDITDLKNTELELQRHKEHLEELVQERTMELEMKNDDLTRYNKLFIGREYRIKELKNEIKIF
jgi:hypothetical protein